MSSAKCREVRDAETREMKAGPSLSRGSTLSSTYAGVFLRTHNSKMVALESGPGRDKMGLATLISSVQAT